MIVVVSAAAFVFVHLLSLYLLLCSSEIFVVWMLQSLTVRGARHYCLG